MTNTYRYYLLGLLTACFIGGATLVAHHAHAQAVQDDTLPIEIQMLHLKLLGKTPDYNSIIYSNPEFQSSDDKFGQEAILNQQFRLLQKLYNDAGKSKPVHASKTLPVVQFSKKARTISFAPVAVDDPVLYQVNPENSFGVFIRNGDILQHIAPPYEFDDFTSLANTVLIKKGQIVSQLMLEPIAADSNPFVFENGDSVHVILADIVELKVIESDSKKLLLHKKFNDNNGLPVPVVVPNNRDYMPLPPATP